jgi:hypothetical protein
MGGIPKDTRVIPLAPSTTHKHRSNFAPSPQAGAVLTAAGPSTPSRG